MHSLIVYMLSSKKKEEKKCGMQRQGSANAEVRCCIHDSDSYIRPEAVASSHAYMHELINVVIYSISFGHHSTIYTKRREREACHANKPGTQ